MSNDVDFRTDSQSFTSNVVHLILHWPSLTSLNKNIGIVKVKEKKIALHVMVKNRVRLIEVNLILSFINYDLLINDRTLL